MQVIEKISKEELRQIADRTFGDMVKAVVDIAKEIVMIDAKPMPRKYLKKTLEVRAGATKIYVYNENGDLAHDVFWWKIGSGNTRPALLPHRLLSQAVGPRGII